MSRSPGASAAANAAVDAPEAIRRVPAANVEGGMDAWVAADGDVIREISDNSHRE